MLISFLNKFIFVANTKTASNTIEEILTPYSQITVNQPYLGKHDTLFLIRHNFNPLFKRGEKGDLGFSDFHKFGVFREPFSWIVSWYNYNSRDAISNPENRNHFSYTHNKSFKDYFKSHVLNSKGTPFTGCQADKFVDYRNDNTIIANSVLCYENLEADFQKVMDTLNVDVPRISRVRKNITKNKKLSVGDLTIDEKSLVENFYKKDFKFYEFINKRNGYINEI